MFLLLCLLLVEKALRKQQQIKHFILIAVVEGFYAWKRKLCSSFSFSQTLISKQLLPQQANQPTAGTNGRQCVSISIESQSHG